MNVIFTFLTCWMIWTVLLCSAMLYDVTKQDDRKLIENEYPNIVAVWHTVIEV